MGVEYKGPPILQGTPLPTMTHTEAPRQVGIGRRVWMPKKQPGVAPFLRGFRARVFGESGWWTATFARKICLFSGDGFLVNSMSLSLIQKLGPTKKNPNIPQFFTKMKHVETDLRGLIVSKTRRYPKNIDTEGDRMVTGLWNLECRLFIKGG